MTLTIHIENDPDTESPMDYDSQWKLYSFSSRHGSYRHPEELGLSLQRDADGKPIIQNPGLRRKLDVGLAFFCSYFEHGNCIWSLRGDPAHPQCRWDSVSVASLLVWEHPPKDMGAKTREERAKDAASFLETYTAWCNGECYYYRIEDENGEDIGSCGGYLGPDLGYMFDSMLEELDDEQLKQPIEFAGDYWNQGARHEWEKALERAKARPTSKA